MDQEHAEWLANEKARKQRKKKKPNHSEAPPASEDRPRTGSDPFEEENERQSII